MQIGKRTIMKANQMNAIAREIRNNRNGFESIVNDFRVYWGKVYRNEVTKVLNDVNEQLKVDKDNKDLKAFRYALETVCAKIKGTTVSDESKAIIKAMHDEDKLTFSCLTKDYIVTALTGLDYVNDEGELCEFRKASKEAEVKTWEPIVKWTESKVGRYFRLATIRINESK